VIFNRPLRLQVTRLPSVCAHPLSVYWTALAHKSDLCTSLWTKSARYERLITRKKTPINRTFLNGHGWARTSDLSRVKRPSPGVKRCRFAGRVATDSALFGRNYCRGVQGFVVVVVPGMIPGPSGVLLSGAPVSSGFDRLEEVTRRA